MDVIGHRLIDHVLRRGHGQFKRLNRSRLEKALTLYIRDLIFGSTKNKGNTVSVCRRSTHLILVSKHAGLQQVKSKPVLCVIAIVWRRCQKQCVVRDSENFACELVSFC